MSEKPCFLRWFTSSGVKTRLGMGLRSGEGVFGGGDRFAANFQNNQVFVEGTGEKAFDAEKMIGFRSGGDRVGLGKTFDKTN